MGHLGEVLKRRRGVLGLSQAELAEGAGVHLRQIRRYESGEQQPVLAVAARLATTLDVSVDELAGVASEQVALEGPWWAAWQLFVEDNEVVATLPVGVTQHGAVFEIEALDTERPWRGELRLWKGPALTGWYADAGGDVRTRGTMFFLLRDGGARAEGRWVGLAADGSLVSGHAALARTREDAQAVIARVTA
jgi:transcriptional regulator with XRE-family HTH domain